MTINSFSRSFLCVCVCVCVCALVAQLCATLCELMPLGLMSLVLLCPCDSPGKNTGVGCHFLLQGIFPAQESNPGLVHCRQILYHLNHLGSSKQRLNKYNLFHLLHENVSVAPLCLTLSDPLDSSPPSSSVHGILQAKIVEWVDILFSIGFFGSKFICIISFQIPLIRDVSTVYNCQDMEAALLLFLCFFVFTEVHSLYSGLQPWKKHMRIMCKVFKAPIIQTPLQLFR